MKQNISAGLPDLGIPADWATMANGHLYTTLAPFHPVGKIETGDPHTQIELTFSNLKRVVEAAGGTMADITFVQIFLTDIAHTPILNEVMSSYFEAPYPNRAVIQAPALAAPGIVIEICVQGYIEQ